VRTAEVVGSDALRLLIVDDAPEYSRMVAELVRLTDGGQDAHIETAASYETALSAFERTPFDVALFDYWLGSRTGLMLMRDLRARGVTTPIVVMTGRGAEEIAVEAMRAGAADYVSKADLTVEVVGRTIRHALALSGEERQRRQAESALRANEERFRALVENSSDALMLVDAEGRVTYITPSSTRQIGRAAADVVGRSIFDFLHPDDREALGSAMADAAARPGGAVGTEIRVQHADGDMHDMEAIVVNRLEDPSVRAIVVTARDVTERRRLEEQLRHAQKMEAIGQLAGGIAHDFNNLLTAILGYCNLILDDMSEADPLRVDLEEIRLAGQRAASLTRQLLAFGRRQILQPQVVDLNSLVGQMERLLRRLIGEDVELVTALSPDIARVRVDAASIEQVLVNLVVNSRDAMPEGGQLTIETSMTDLDRSYAGVHVAETPGRYVMLAVADTGHGMDAATRARIFEPFFTTKPQGKGTGLGLATVYGIVKQNGGHIWVYSEVDRGTVLKVYLPVAESDGARQDNGRPAAAHEDRGWETVLLVEDEDAVRTLAREVLRRHGYVVLEARHGVDALRIAEQHSDPIHLMISDVVMPHMSGRDLAARLVTARPGMKVLFMSGYTDHAVMHRDLTPDAAFLQKPFTPENLARKVRSVLEPLVRGTG
jgi:two-component system, cell cycle sensor histidine kinase and response regulator CckA